MALATGLSTKLIGPTLARTAHRRRRSLIGSHQQSWWLTKNS